ncbi:MAG: DUF1553 domain-containing protein [Thermoguttaceae bacterium]
MKRLSPHFCAIFLAMQTMILLAVFVLEIVAQTQDSTPKKQKDMSPRRIAKLANEQIEDGRRAKQQQAKEQRAGQKETFDNPFASSKSFFSKNEIDRLLVESLKQHNIEPAGLCRDSLFIRRVSLDITGTLPTAQQTRDFLLDFDPNKREKLIEQLLSSPQFVDYWTLKWSDILRIKAEFPINLWPAGAACYYRWIHDSIRTNKRYDEFVRELITADGSNFRDGAANFYRAVQSKDAETLAEMVALTFLGERTGPWSEEKLRQMSTFFSRISYKSTAEWKEEVVYWNRKPLDSDSVTFPDGSTGTVLPDQDPREVFADWLVSPKNRAFQRNVVNRVWFSLFGRGFIHEPDDIRETNPPIHPEVLDWLCDELVRSNYDIKHLIALILNSATYQQASIPQNPNMSEMEMLNAAKLFAVYPIRRLDAEVLQDAFAKIFDIPVGYTSEVPEPFANIPGRLRTIGLQDASITSSFLEMFGRPSRDTGLTSDRNNNINESQQLFLLNSTEVNNWSWKFLSRYNTNNVRLPDEKIRIMNDIWLTFLSRFPTDYEMQQIRDSFDQSKSSTQLLQDLIWSLLNSKEFLCQH